MAQKIFVGIDGGGTYTRVLVTDLNFNVLNYVNYKGSPVPIKDANAAQNMQNAMKLAIGENFLVENVAGFCAGLAGVDFDDDLIWAREIVAPLGLKCEPVIVNDCIPAHYGAFWQANSENECKIISDKIVRGAGFCTNPGIIAVGGTGSIVTAINDSGAAVTNYDFHHYAGPRARDLAYLAVYRLIAGEFNDSDKELKAAILNHFNAADVAGLTKLGVSGFILDDKLRDKFFGELAPEITDAAKCGSAAAKAVCNIAVDDIVRGINLVAGSFKLSKISVVLMGGVLKDDYISGLVKSKLKSDRFVVKEPVFDACMGAVKMAAAGKI